MNCRWLPVQSIRDDTPQGHLLCKLLRHGICAICMHTNLDVAPGGVNDALAAALGLEDPGPLCENGLGPGRHAARAHVLAGVCKARLPGLGLQRRALRRRGQAGLPGGGRAAAPAASLKRTPRLPGAIPTSRRT